MFAAWSVLIEEKLGGTILLYPQALRKEALELAEKRRETGERIQMLRKSSRRPFEEYKEYAKRMEADVLLYLETGEKLSAVEIV